VTYDAYGTSDNDPIINGSDLITTWSNTSGNIWQATASTQVIQVFFNNQRGVLATSQANVNGVNKWYWSSNILYIYSTSDPATNFTDPGIEATPDQRVCFHAWDQSNLIVKNIHVTKGYYGFWFHGGSANAQFENVESGWNYNEGLDVEGAGSINPTVTNASVHDNSRHGLNFYSGANNAVVTGGSFYNNNTTVSCTNPFDERCGGGIIFNTVIGGRVNGVSSYGNYYGIKTYGPSTTNVTIENNVVYNNALFGIDVDGSGDGIVVQNNEVYGNTSHGIAIEVNTPNTIVRYNKTHNNGVAEGAAGIELDTTVNSQVYYNLIYNENNGIGIYTATSPKVYNNTIYNLTTSGINSFSSSGIILKNNVIDIAGFATIDISASSQTGFTSDFNLWNNSGSNEMRWGNTLYSFADWKQQSSQDTNSNEADPLLVNPPTDFHLQSSSPAINAGVDVGLVADYAGISVPQGSTPDIGAYEYVPLTVTINQAVGQSDPTNISPVNFTVVFSESVSDFTTGDVTLSGTAGATTATVTGSGTTYNVTITGMTSSGTVIATLNSGIATGATENTNASSTSTDNTVTYDNSAPVTTDSGIDTSWHNSAVTVTLNCVDVGSGCAHTYYTTDGSTPTVLSPSGSGNITTFTLSSDGQYSVKYFSVDILGNQETVKTASNTVKIGSTTNNTTNVSNNSSNSSTSSPSCNDTTPTGISDLFQINVNSTTAKLFFTPISSTNRYHISFSTKPNAEEHGADVTLAREGVQNFTVNLLKPNTTYYFKVRGLNGCMAGNWSNIMKITTKAKGVTKTIPFYKTTNIFQKIVSKVVSTFTPRKI